MRILSLDGLFLRDDVVYDAEIEMAIETESPQGLYRPKWDGEKWVEDMTTDEIEALKVSEPPEPTAEERLAGLEQAVLDMMGGMFQ